MSVLTPPDDQDDLGGSVSHKRQREPVTIVASETWRPFTTGATTTATSTATLKLLKKVASS